MKALYIANGNTYGQPAALAARRLTKVMSTPIVTVDSTESLGVALTRMVGRKVRHLVVVGEDGRCLGVLSDRSIAGAWAMDHSTLDSCPVFAALDPEPSILGADKAVLDAARLMRSSGVDAVAVVNDAGAPIGIVTGSDLISLLAR